MAIEVIPINGKSPYVDYNVFEVSVKEILGSYCKNAKIFLLNNFPIVISTQIKIDLLLIIAIENIGGNYYIIKKSKENNKNIYLHNQIIPVSFITEYENNILYQEEDSLFTKDENIYFNSEIKELNWNLKKYLVEKVKLEDNNKLFINPLIFIFNNKVVDNIIADNILVSKNFDFHNINKYFKKSNNEFFNSYNPWKLDFTSVNKDVYNINNRASKDSEYGYLTKIKIERLQKQFYNIKSLPEELNNYLIMFKGKAGTGKTNRLLSIAQNHLKKGENILFLTYNKLLVYDFSLQIYSILKDNNEKHGQCKINTIHKFFFDLCSRLRVIRIMHNDRFNELIETLKKRVEIIYPIFINNFMNKGDKNKTLTLVQNSFLFNKAEKDEAIELCNYYFKVGNNMFSRENYIKYKENKTKELLEKDIFLEDYSNIIKNTHLILNNDKNFFQTYNIEDKIDIFKDKNYIGKDNENKVTEREFNKFISFHKRANKKKRTIFIDEAQDCYFYEKEILLEIFDPKNFVISNGEKEQLIRYTELCDWSIHNNKKIDIKTHNLRDKNNQNISFRIKEEIINFCNFIAQKAGIRLDLKPINSDDKGEIIFDFRSSPNVVSLFESMNNKGKILGARPYESILALITPRLTKKDKTADITTNIRINENDVILIDENRNMKGKWSHEENLNRNGFSCYSGTEGNKEPIFSFDDIRTIFYDSCRGLESFSVCCFDINYFFLKKYNDIQQSEHYRISEIYDDYGNQLDSEKRKQMYKTNWLLMALTRTMDTLYIQITKDNEKEDSVILWNLINEYIEQNKDNKNIRVIR